MLGSIIANAHFTDITGTEGYSSPSSGYPRKVFMGEYNHISRMQFAQLLSLSERFQVPYIDKDNTYHRYTMQRVHTDTSDISYDGEEYNGLKIIYREV